METNNLRDPDFAFEKDVILRSSEGMPMTDSTLGLTLKVNVILLSYNRPNMIREAIKSVLDQTYENWNLWIADDGSDFDVEELVEEIADERVYWFQRDRIPSEQRAKQSRIAENINAVIENVPNSEFVTYLCDDDVFERNWFARSISCLEHSPTHHVVVGDSHYFFDGSDFLTESRPGIPLKGLIDQVPKLWWSMGSFMHKAYCWREEKVKWFDSAYGHSIDTNFISDLWNVHQNYLMLDKVAVYRREHENMLSAKLGRKDENGYYYIGHKPGRLKADMIDGLMENE